MLYEVITKSFPGGQSPAVNDVSFSVSEGETLVLLGSSGCGKSTTLKLVNRLLEPDSGDIFYKNKPVRDWNLEELRRSIGYVIQGVGLFLV